MEDLDLDEIFETMPDLSVGENGIDINLDLEEMGLDLPDAISVDEFTINYTPGDGLTVETEVDIDADGKLAIIDPTDFSKMKDATIFMNGMNVDQRQMLDYAQELNKTGKQDIYMIANIDKGKTDDMSDVLDGRKGLFEGNQTNRNEELEKLDKEIEKLQDRIADREYIIKQNEEKGNPGNTESHNRYHKKEIKRLEAEIKKREDRKIQTADDTDLSKNAIRNFRDNKPINALKKLLETGQATNILSHSQGSLNVSIALGIVGKSSSESVQRELKNVNWTSLGGAYSERNIYELPDGLDVHLYYNEDDDISRRSDALGNDATEGARAFENQKRNQLARRKFGNTEQERDRRVRVEENGGSHDFQDYLWGSTEFFRNTGK